MELMFRKFRVQSFVRFSVQALRVGFRAYV